MTKVEEAKAAEEVKVDVEPPKIISEKDRKEGIMICLSTDSISILSSSRQPSSRKRG